MRLDNDRGRHTFQNVVQELRDELDLRKFIDRRLSNKLQWLWSKARNRAEGKDWIRATLIDTFQLYK